MPLVPTSRRGLTIGLLLCVTAVAFEAQAAVTAMPAAADDLGDLPLYAWAFTAVVLPQIVAVAIAGRAADRLGPVKPLAVGLAVFALGCVVAGLAPTMLLLLVGRFVQGLGGGATSLALMVVAGLAYAPAERARVMTWFSTCWILPSFLGPAVAAWLAETFSWHWVFWAVLPFVVLGAAFMAPFLGRVPAPEGDASAPVPVAAAVSVAVGIGLLQAAGQRLGWSSLAVAAVGVALLVWRFGRLMPARFSLAGNGLSAVIVVRMLAAGSFFGAQAFLPLMLTQRGASLLMAGGAITLASSGWWVGSWLQSRPWLRVSRDRIVAMGALAVAAGLLTVAVSAWLPDAGIWPAIAGVTVAGLGMGLYTASTSLAVMQLSPAADLGRNTSSLQVGEMTGNALWAGIAGTIFVALDPAGHDAVTYGTMMATLALVAVVAVLVSRRIGYLENHAARV